MYILSMCLFQRTLLFQKNIENILETEYYLKFSIEIYTIIINSEPIII